jgi:murein DD-endopeptidase MepM/ murein hydrolase activator NlpD
MPFVPPLIRRETVATSARSLAELDALEAMVARTGINLADLLDETPGDTAALGQGGPLIPVALDFGEAARGGFVGAVARLESHVGQLEELRRIVTCVPWVAPVDNYQSTSRFGKRRDPITGQMSRHMGIDLAGITGTPVLATAPGRVTFAGTKTGYGKFIEIDHDCGIVTRYAHLRRIMVKPGDDVDHRAQIGTLGSTGRSTGPHVHYEVVVEGTELDPANFLEAGRHVFR